MPQRLYYKFIVVLLSSIILNLSLTIGAYHIFNDKDISNLPPKTNNYFDDRFISLLFYNVSTYTTLGDAKMYPESKRAKLYTITYVIITSALLVTIADMLN